MTGTMEEQNTEEQRRRETLPQREIEYYSNLINASINTQMEVDRQILTISSLALGVLVTFLKEPKDSFAFFLWFFSGLFFIITILISLIIFKKNSALIRKQVRAINGENVDTEEIECSLKMLDKIMYSCFILGIITIFVFAIKIMDFNIVLNWR